MDLQENIVFQPQHYHLPLTCKKLTLNTTNTCQHIKKTFYSRISHKKTFLGLANVSPLKADHGVINQRNQIKNSFLGQQSSTGAFKNGHKQRITSESTAQTVILTFRTAQNQYHNIYKLTRWTCWKLFRAAVKLSLNFSTCSFLWR